MKTCKTPGCNKKHYGKGYCCPCWNRERRRGTAEYFDPRKKISFENASRIILTSATWNKPGRVG